jgi:hypothetical protein
MKRARASEASASGASRAPEGRRRARVVLGAIFGTAALLPGCPIYPSYDECYSSADCPKGMSCNYYGECVSPGGYAGSSSGGPGCDEPNDCDTNETCAASGECLVGDCVFHGCVAGYSCVVENGSWTCVETSSLGSGGSGGAAGAAGAAGSGGWAGEPDASSDAAAAGAAGTAGMSGTGGAAAGAGGAGGSTAGAAGAGGSAAGAAGSGAAGVAGAAGASGGAAGAPAGGGGGEAGAQVSTLDGGDAAGDAAAD